MTNPNQESVDVFGQAQRNAAIAFGSYDPSSSQDQTEYARNTLTVERARLEAFSSIRQAFSFVSVRVKPSPVFILPIVDVDLVGPDEVHRYETMQRKLAINNLSLFLIS